MACFTKLLILTSISTYLLAYGVEVECGNGGVRESQPQLALLSKVGLDSDMISHLIEQGQGQARTKRSPQETQSTPEDVGNTAEKTKELNGTDTDDPYNLNSPPSDEKYKKRRDEYLTRVRSGEGYLPKVYRKDEPPRLTVTQPNGVVINIPIPADILINLRSVLSIDEVDERILLDMDYTINWLDAKILDLAFLGRIDQPEYISMPKLFIDKIWIPDVYLDNLVELKELKFMEAPISIAFDPVLGIIKYSQRLVPNVKCGMDFHYYPADTQVCEFSLRSYSYSTADMVIQWTKPLGIYFQDTTDANFDLRIDDVEDVVVPEELHYKGPNISYSTVRFKLYAKRKLSYHLIQTYIPSVFFVVITWLCFLLPPAMVEARIGITMTTLLTLTAMFASVRESTPIVSYAKAVDIWMSICILFIFLTLFEFAVMVWINYRTNQMDEEEAKRVVEVQLDESETKERGLKRQGTVLSISSVRRRKLESVAHTIEKLALPIYSIAFLAFAVAYWVWLLNAADYLKWDVDPKYNKIEE